MLFNYNDYSAQKLSYYRLAPGDEIKMVNGEDVSGSGGYWTAIKLLSQDVASLEVERKMAPLNWSTNEAQLPGENPPSGSAGWSH